MKEDEMVVKLVNQLGPKKWSVIASNLPGRIGKQCRERWHNHLNPDIRKDAWSPEEDALLIKLHSQIGNRWAEIAKVLKGRCVREHAYFCFGGACSVRSTFFLL